MLRAIEAWILARFVVEPSAGRSLGFLDGLRGIACLLVVADHTWGWAPGTFLWPLPGQTTTLDLTPLVSHGGIGVEIFFVLSGFLLAQTWLRAHYQGKPRPGIKTYFKLRAARMLPAYYACFFLLFILFIPRVIVPALLYSGGGLFCAVSQATFTQFFFPTCSQSFWIDGATWTLTMEITFYLVLPVAVRFFYGRGWVRALPAALLVSLGWNYLCSGPLLPLVPTIMKDVAKFPEVSKYFTVGMANGYLQLQFPAHAVDFALGITLANFFVRRQLGIDQGRWVKAIFGAWPARAAFWGGLLLMGVVIYQAAPGFNFVYDPQRSSTPWPYIGIVYEPLIALGFALVLGGVIFSGTWLKALFGCLPLRLAGVISYSVYLWHGPILTLVTSYPSMLALPPTQRFVIMYSIIVALVVLLAGFMYLTVEKPFMLRARQSVRRARAAETREMPSADLAPSVAGSPLLVPALAGTRPQAPQ